MDVADGLRVRHPQAILLHAHTNGLSQEFECKILSCSRRDALQKDHSNERYSRNSRGISSLSLQRPRSGDTIGVLERFHIQCHRPTGEGRRG